MSKNNLKCPLSLQPTTVLCGCKRCYLKGLDSIQCLDLLLSHKEYVITANCPSKLDNRGIILHLLKNTLGMSKENCT